MAIIRGKNRQSVPGNTPKFLQSDTEYNSDCRFAHGKSFRQYTEKIAHRENNLNFRQSVAEEAGTWSIAKKSGISSIICRKNRKCRQSYANKIANCVNLSWEKIANFVSWLLNKN